MAEAAGGSRWRASGGRRHRALAAVGGGDRAESRASGFGARSTAGGALRGERLSGAGFAPQFSRGGGVFAAPAVLARPDRVAPGRAAATLPLRGTRAGIIP